MKKHKTLLLLFLLLLSLPLYIQGATVPEQNSERGRETTLLNRLWKYKRGDIPDAARPQYNDTDWEPIGLPHSFSIPYFMSKDFYVGYGWYRRHLKLEKEDLSKRLFLEFDGVFQEAEIYVNGRLAGSHTGGYTGFSIDFTPCAVEGDNVIAVRVNNLWQATVAPRGGEHVFSGGIYRNVRLVKKQPVYLDWYGTAITTPTLEKNAGKSSAVKVKASVKNTSAHTGRYTLSITIKDSSGRTVTKCSKTECVEAGKSLDYEIQTSEISSPALWSPASPTLYTLVSQLYDGKHLLDSEEITFGFRWFEWTADKGFFLNGKHYYFRGANVHQDQAGWGDAVTDAAARRDVHLMKEAGFDMIRGSHYPHSPAFTDACDREGMLFWSETPFWSTAGPKEDGGWTAGAYPSNVADTAAFEANVLRQLEEMIRIHRNHPSVFVWSMCNEPFFTDSQTMPGVKKLLKRMVEKAHSLDNTRKAGVGGVQRPLGEDRIDLIGDVAGYNGDGANIPDFQQPPVPSVVTEYGSTKSDRPGQYIPGWGDLERDDSWKGRAWRSGQAIWCGFDHGSIFGSDMTKLGIVDYFRLPKRSWYWYRNAYTQVAPPEWPKEGKASRLLLKASKTDNIATDGTDDTQLIVVVADADGRELSNTPVVTLRVVSGPGEFPTGKSITFRPDSDIRILDGKAAIAFRSYYAGNTIIEASSPGLSPARLTLGFVGEEPYQKGVSQEVTDRPYVRYVKNTEHNELQTYGLNNPTFASSSRKGHSPGLAADGNEDSYWMPAEDDRSAYWILDTERGLMLNCVTARFTEKVICNFKIEISDDKETWYPIGVYNASDNEQDIRLELEKPLKMRFIRFSFTTNESSDMPRLAEVRAEGSVTE